MNVGIAMRNRFAQFMDDSPRIAPDESESQDVVNSLFAALVERQIRGDVLTYSARQDLFESARRLGISRFHANLIIAAVQHELRGRAERLEDFADIVIAKKATATRSALTIGLVVGSMQTLLLLGIWYLMKM